MVETNTSCDMFGSYQHYSISQIEPIIFILYQHYFISQTAAAMTRAHGRAQITSLKRPTKADVQTVLGFDSRRRRRCTACVFGWGGLAGWLGWPAPSYGYCSHEPASSTSLSHQRTTNDTNQPTERPSVSGARRVARLAFEAR